MVIGTFVEDTDRDERSEANASCYQHRRITLTIFNRTAVCRHHTILIVDILMIEVVQLRVMISPTKRIAALFRYFLNANVALFYTLYQLTNANDIIERRMLRRDSLLRTRHGRLAIAAKRADHEYQKRY